MSFDDDADEDAPGFRRPPHPDDRLWRHPSEMDDHPIAPIGAPGDAASARRHGSGQGHARRAIAGVALGVVVIFAGLAALIAGDLDGGTGGSSGDRAGMTAGGGSRRPDERVMAGVVDAVAPSVVGLDTGSGVVISADGLVLTSAALVEGPGPVPVRLPDGATAEASVVGVDEMTGLGVLDLPGEGHTAATLADPAADAAADPGSTMAGAAYTIAVSDGSERPAAAAGVVGASRKLRGTSGSDLDGVLEVEGDAAAPAALGGPVVGPDGAVIGVTTALGGERSSYFTPIDVGQKVAGDLLEWGRVHHSWLGIEGMDRIEGPGLHARGGHGAEVARVAASGPAAAAGVQPGDVIVEFDGRPIERMSDLIRWLRALSPGHQAEITLERGGETVTATAVLGEQAAGP